MTARFNLRVYLKLLKKFAYNNPLIINNTKTGDLSKSRKRRVAQRGGVHMGHDVKGVDTLT